MTWKLLKPRNLACLAIGTLLLGLSAIARADGRVVGERAPEPSAPRSAETRLRALEIHAIGPEHAASHARQREFARQARRDGGEKPARPRAAVARVVSAAEGGSWADARPIPVIAINAIMLPTGKVLMFAYPGRPGSPGYEDPGDYDYAKAFVWDPVSGVSTQVDPPTDPVTGKPTNIWCGGASLLPDGRVLVTGGNVDDPRTDFHGIDTVLTFNPFTEQWDPPQTNARMAQGRWYPSQVLMPDGRTIVVGGLTRPGDPDFGIGNGTNNDLELISPDGTIERQPGFYNSVGGFPLSGEYPRLFWMPSGRALAAGPFVYDTWFVTPSAPGARATLTDFADLGTDREWGTAVLLSGGRVMTFGGSPPALADPIPPDGELPERSARPAQNTTEIFDENNPSAGWRSGPAMKIGRSHANSVLLPDGKVATVGGGFGEDPGHEFYRWRYSEDQKQVELFDPVTNSTTLGNPQSEARTYHSTALLLPDGRVMSAGDDVNGPGGPGTGTSSDTAEIYSPPYLFRKDGSGSLAPRPVIDQAPSAMRLGAEFEIKASGAAATRAVLVAPGAATHATDMSQRLVALAAPQARPDGRLALSLPSDVDVAPPGYYMLFLLSADDVPSVSKFVRLEAPSLAPRAPAVAAPLVPGPLGPEAVSGDLKPSMRITGVLPRIRTLTRMKRFTISIQVSEPAKVTLSALLDRGRNRGREFVTRRALHFKAPGKRRVTFWLTRAGLRMLGRERRARVRIRAKGVFHSGRTLPPVQVRRMLR